MGVSLFGLLLTPVKTHNLVDRNGSKIEHFSITTAEGSRQNNNTLVFVANFNVEAPPTYTPPPVVINTPPTSESVFKKRTDFNTADLRRVALKVGFTGVKKLKDLSNDDLMVFYSRIETGINFMKQLNINSWGVCEYYKIDNFDIYNYYYNDITRETYDLYCRELNALMLLDGTIEQLR